MAFNTRPELTDIQFKQLSGTTLTLSGSTRINSYSGLSLMGDNGYVPIIVTGETNNYVLTYDGLEGVIKLKQQSGSGGGIYPYEDKVTCPVGGIANNTCLYNEPIEDIIQKILVPTKNPTLTDPFVCSISISPSTTLYEVGSELELDITTLFSAGCINPQYTSASSCRSGGAFEYMYTLFGVSNNISSGLESNVISDYSHTVTNGANNLSVKVCYCCGVQPFNSSGNPYSTPLVQGITCTKSVSICGLYPWYWGTVASGGVASGVNRPSVSDITTIINTGSANKVVGNSNGTISVTYNSDSDDYIWFAIPYNSTTKTIWYETALNNGTIGGIVSSGGNLFPNEGYSYNVSSITNGWTNQDYKIYVSNYQTSAGSLEFRNS